MRKNLIMAFGAALLTLVLPFIAVTFKGGDEGTAMAVILFFLVSPMATILIGMVSGQDIKSYWFQPLLFSLFFTFGMRTFLKAGANEFMRQGIKTLILGYAVALLSAWFTYRRQKAAGKEAENKND